MTMEADLYALLHAVCERVYPDIAPQGTALPYVTWQGLGGEDVTFADGSATDKRFPLIQVDAWSATRLEALTLIRSIEAAMRASAAFVAVPQGEPISTTEPGTQLRGCIQRFEMVATR